MGAAIPQGFLDQNVIDQFYSPNYARIIAYTSTDVESDEAFSTVEAVQQAAARHYDTYYTAGQSANLYDMKNNVVVSAVAIIAILIVLLVTFRSLTLPLVLLLTIESGIWINLSIPYFMGESVNFIGYLVINTVQLGATIDYGILLTTHYLRHRRRVPARKAAHLGRNVPVAARVGWHPGHRWFRAGFLVQHVGGVQLGLPARPWSAAVADAGHVLPAGAARAA